MRFLNYIVDGFGFKNLQDVNKSSFGYINEKVKIMGGVLALATMVSEYFFGFTFIFLCAYVGLILLEWITGVAASLKRGEQHKSRKLGRMLLKVAIYTVLIVILNLMAKESKFTTIGEFELDPFSWLYWVILIVIIWQLVVSVLENLTSLGVKWAAMALKIINARFYKQFNLNDEGHTT